MFSSNDNLYERYEPNRYAAISCLVLFVALTMWHYMKYRTSPYAFGSEIHRGGLVEVVAFSSRLISMHYPDNEVSYILQRALMFLAPLNFTGALFVFFKGLMYGSGYSNLSLTWYVRQTALLIISIYVCFILHCCGIGILYLGPESTRDSGKFLILTGLVIQIAALLISLLCVAVFSYRIIHRGLLRRTNPHVRLMPMTVMVSVFTCYMLVRNFFRVLEMFDDVNGYLVSHEWTLYVFDISVMAIIMLSTFPWYKEDLKMEKFNSNVWYVNGDGDLLPWRDGQT